MRNKRKGFTLIELVVVLGIIAVVASLVIVYLGQSRKRSNYIKVLHDMQEISNAAVLYHTRTGNWPDDNRSDILVNEGYLSVWPTPPCKKTIPDIAYDWDYWKWGGTAATYYPVVRVTLRTPQGSAYPTSHAFYYCIVRNQNNECDCNSVYDPAHPEDYGYCAGAGSIEVGFPDQEIDCATL